MCSGECSGEGGAPFLAQPSRRGFLATGANEKTRRTRVSLRSEGFRATLDQAPSPTARPGPASAHDVPIAGRRSTTSAAVLALWALSLVVPMALLAIGTLRQVLRSALDNALQLRSLPLALALFAAPPVLLWIARRRRPSASIAVMGWGAAAAVVLAAAGARALAPLLSLALLLLCARELGRPFAARATRSGATRAEAMAFGLGLGSTLLSLLGLALGSAGLLTRTGVWILVGACLVAVLWRRFSRAPRRLPRLAEWWDWPAATAAPPLLEQAALALGLGSLLVASTLALAPEVQSDAVRMHLALARRFAETGALGWYGQWPISAWPLLGQVLYALGTLVGGPAAAKLWHAAAAAGLALATGLLGNRLGGRTAGVAASAVVASLPMVGWLLGTAYVDLFAAFFAVLGALGLVAWQQTGRTAWMVLAGAAAGSAVAAKLTAGFVLLGLLLATAVVGGASGRIAERLRGLAAFALGTGLALGPWLARSFALTDTLPGLSLLRDGLLRGKGPPPPSLANLPGFGTGRDMVSLFRLPWDLTFHTGLFGEHTDGFAGFALLALAPLLALLPRTRAVAAMATTVLVATLLWFFTAQYLRYLLPAVALAAALVGGGLSRLIGFAAGEPAPMRLVSRVYVGLLAGSLVCGPLFYLSTVFFVFPGSLPTHLVLGQETPESYLASRVVSYRVLRRLDRIVPPGTPVVMLPDGPQVYTHARLISNMTGGIWVLTASSADSLADRFAERGVRHLVLQHGAIPSSWKNGVLFQPAFLERHARLLHEAAGTSLYEVGRGTGATARAPSTRHQNSSLLTMPRAGSSSRAYSTEKPSDRSSSSRSVP